MEGVHWRHQANAIEPSMCGGDAALLSNYFDHFEGSVHKGSVSRNPNFSGNEFLCFASFTSSFYRHALAIVY